MGKMLISNDCAANTVLATKFIDAGFQLSKNIAYNNIVINIFKKLRVSNVNFYGDQDNFVAINGTLLYKGLFGEQALKSLLEDSQNENIDQLRKKMIGSYAVVIKKNSKLVIFVDETHTYNLYYQYNEENQLFTVTNSYIDIKKTGPQLINDMSLSEGLVRCTLGLETTFQDVKRLSAKQYIEVDFLSGKFIIKKLNLNSNYKKYETKDDAINDLYSEVAELSKIKSKYFSNSILFLTGGIDSRLQLAVDLLGNCKPIIGYWSGSDVITNGAEQDCEISKKLAKTIGSQFNYYDVSEQYDECLNDIKKRQSKYGEHSSIYGGNQKWYDIFENLNGIEFVEFGYSGEIMREISALDRAYHSEFTMSDFIEKVYDRGGIKKNLIQLSNLDDYIASNFCNMGIDIDVTNLSIDDCSYLFSCSRFSADCQINNFINMFAYSFPMFFQKRIIDIIFSMPYEWLSDSNISVRLIEKLDRSLLTIPIYSHHRDYKYEPKRHSIKESTIFALIDALKPFLVNTRIYRTLYLNFAHKYIRPKSIDNDRILKKCIEIMNTSKLIKSTEINVLEPRDWKTVDVAALAVVCSGLTNYDYA